jgi:hypothetical protein
MVFQHFVASKHDLQSKPSQSRALLSNSWLPKLMVRRARGFV